MSARPGRSVCLFDEATPGGGRVEALLLHYRGGYFLDVRPYTVPLPGARRYDVDACKVLPIGGPTPYRATTLAGIAADPRTEQAARLVAAWLTGQAGEVSP